ncbi:HAD-IIB family hydrolase [Georhizobium profundi]|uniref:HAD-IIB family hydrolase n=1 Tax=Georhizobium profundi TaxID=2341112 RepID=A0A3S9B1Y2_9HYPH|nr:HAD-IIB family hydrolase [Georhizobium profundi]AZN70949.1 HAD-IIB family hydrolase [Georhizobium profundi]
MIIFSDLDGTLLDHATYSFDAARPALDVVKANGIPLIFATSKTAAEIEPLREATGIHLPAIVENGAGIAWPGHADGQEDAYRQVRAALDRVPKPLRALYRSFGDMDDAEVAGRTGLSLEGASLARRRLFSEPGLFSGSAEERAAFLDALKAEGLSAVQGGRFLTISAGASKADRMTEIVAWHEAETGRAGRPTLALGDAANDIAMLEAADYGVVVANRAHPPLAPLAGEHAGRISRTEKEGPAGWNEAVLSFIRRVGAIEKGTAQ